MPVMNLQEGVSYGGSTNLQLAGLALIVLASMCLATVATAQAPATGGSQLPIGALPSDAKTIAIDPKAIRTVEQLRMRKVWRTSLVAIPRPKKGCYKASFPDATWQEVACAAPPKYRYRPGRRAISHIVGSGGIGDFSARLPALISSAEGSFDSVSEGVTEAGQDGGQGPQVADAYSLQLNTNFFGNPTACGGAAPGAGCEVWEQFIFANDGEEAGAFIQYWLVNYNNPSCPANWQAVPNSSGNDCVRNAPNGATPVPPVAVSDLALVRLIGAASSTSDSMIFVVDDTGYLTTGDNSVNASRGWQDAEFNIFGNGDDSQANFGPNSTLIVRTAVSSGKPAAPTCEQASFTGETNNLDLSGTPSMVPDSSLPAVVFTEINGPATRAGCAAAPGTGGSQMLVPGDAYVDFGKDTTGLNHYSVNGAMCVVHSPSCPSNALGALFGVGHDGKDHFFPADAALPSGVRLDAVLYNVYWPAGIDHTDRGGVGSKGSYGADADKEFQKGAPLYSVHWQNACQPSTGADWGGLPLTYQISFLVTVPSGVAVSGAQPLSTPSGDICRASDQPAASVDSSTITTSTFLAYLSLTAPSQTGFLAWATIFPWIGAEATSTPIPSWNVLSITNVNKFDVFLVDDKSSTADCFKSGHGQVVKANTAVTNLAP